MKFRIKKSGLLDYSKGSHITLKIPCSDYKSREKDNMFVMYLLQSLRRVYGEDAIKDISQQHRMKGDVK